MRRGERLRDERTEAEPHEHHRAAYMSSSTINARRSSTSAFSSNAGARGRCRRGRGSRGPTLGSLAPRERDAEVAQSPTSLAEVVEEHHVHDVGVVGLAPDVVPQPRADGERQERGLLRPRAEDAVQNDSALASAAAHSVGRSRRLATPRRWSRSRRAPPRRRRGRRARLSARSGSRGGKGGKTRGRDDVAVVPVVSVSHGEALESAVSSSVFMEAAGRDDGARAEARDDASGARAPRARSRGALLSPRETSVFRKGTDGGGKATRQGDAERSFIFFFQGGVSRKKKHVPAVAPVSRLAAVLRVLLRPEQEHQVLRA